METRELLDTNVIFTRSSGLITIFSVIEYPPSSKRDFDILFPDSMDYATALRIAEQLRKVGKPLGAVDILIAAMCINRSLTLVTKDNDFLAVHKVIPEFRVTVDKSPTNS